MSDRIWNAEQQAAISARNKSVVVSAAAGSGKTSVLTERVLQLIEEGEDIERMLIVTFTNLAAGEMRERIYKRLQDASDGVPRLAVQAEKCVFADISTIHAFCGHVIRDNFEHARVSPTFVIEDEAGVRMLKQNAMDLTIEHAMQDIRMQRFAAKYASRGDMQNIKNIIFTIYNRVISCQHPYEWLDSASQNFDADTFMDMLFAEYKRMVSEAAANAEVHLKARADILRERGYYEEADLSENDRIEMLRTINTLTIDNAWLPEFGYIILPKVKGAPSTKTQTNRANGCFSNLQDYSGDFFSKVKGELNSTAEDGKIFIDLTRAFIKRYAKAKRAKNVLDHDDTIHFALRALSVPQIAKRYQGKYAHVFVDEYQDINNAQNAIIKLVQCDDNDFLVGDVKQCIYMFRESNPDLLIGRCRELAKTGLVEMSTNYRSGQGIIDFINSVMHHMMTEEAGGVAYTGGQCLEAGTEGAGTVEVVLAGIENEDKIASEGIEIGKCIRKLVEEGYEYRDIAILRPEVSTSGRHIAKILSDMDIPVVSGFVCVEADFSEISVFINLLCLLGDRVSDVALLSVMRYPHFGFTASEMASIRIVQHRSKDDEDKSFYHAVQTFSEDSKLGTKVENFIREIEHYQKLSECLLLPDFLMRLRQEAEFKEYAVTSPAGKSSDQAVRSFINTVSSMRLSDIGDVLDIADKIQAETDQPTPGEINAVYITTIHKSKGLEFPVVFLSGMHKKINKSDAAGTVLVGRALGLALDNIDEQERIKQPTFHKMAVARNMRREKISETVRLLYVGMTRAIKRLVIIGADEKIKDKWCEDEIDGWQHTASTYFDLVMPAVFMECTQSGRDVDDIVRFAEDDAVNVHKVDRSQRLQMLFAQAEDAEPEDVYIEYHHQHDLGVPSKVSVSALKRLSEPEQLWPVFRPSEHADISAAQRGTLIHKVLQKIGFEKKSAEEVETCVREMVENGIIESIMEKYVDAKVICGFLNSDMAARASRADRCLHEAPFCLQMGADEAGLAESDECVVVQGVIDMCFVENDSWVVVDYKTDRIDRNTAKVAAQKYKIQLELYCKALERITKIKVKEKYIYYLAISEAVLLQ